MMRADRLLVVRGFAPTRSAAARLIERGALKWRQSEGGWSTARKCGELLDERCALDVVDDAELRYASRAGLKLEGALEQCGVEVAGKVCLDVGQSTGGFTDVLLRRRAQHVVGVDVGHGQLHAALREDPRVTAIEGVNVRRLDARQLPRARFDLVVADLSFISLVLVLPALAPLIAGDVLLLVKPQFELQPGDIGKGGIVKNAAAYERVERRLRDACNANRLVPIDWFESPISGGDGNREFFLRAERSEQ